MARLKRRHHHSNAHNDELDTEIENGHEEIENAAEGMEAAGEDIEDEAAETAEAIGSAGAETVQAATRQMRRIQRSAFDAFDMFGGPMTRLMDQNWSNFQRLMHAVQEESLNLVNRRLEHTSHAIESSRECEGLSGLLSVQQEWMVDFARDYAEHGKRFAEIMRGAAQDGASKVTDATSGIASQVRDETYRSLNDWDNRRPAA
jgi:chromosome segregation ATPase